MLARLKAPRRENATTIMVAPALIDPDPADFRPDVWGVPGRGPPALLRTTPDRHAISSARAAQRREPVRGGVHGRLIALRFVHDPLLAVHHSSISIAGFSRTEARAAYWLGRAKLEVGASAMALFRRGREPLYTYYGGFARQAVERANVCEFRAPALSARAIEAQNEDAFKAVRRSARPGGVLNAYILTLPASSAIPRR
jgi:hypothetical protein